MNLRCRNVGYLSYRIFHSFKQIIVVVSLFGGSLYSNSLESPQITLSNVNDSLLINDTLKPVISLRYISNLDELSFRSLNNKYRVNDFSSADKKPKSWEKAMRKVNKREAVFNSRKSLKEAILKTNYSVLEFYGLLKKVLGNKSTSLPMSSYAYC